MAQIEIGAGRTAAAGYHLSDVSLVPTRRTRATERVDISWQLDAYRFDLPLVVTPTDAVVSPETAIAIGRLGGLAPLDAEGLWTRHEDPAPLLAELSDAPVERVTRRLRELHDAPIREDLLVARVAEVAAAGVTTAVRVSPSHTERLAPAILRAAPDVLVVHGSVVSAEHVGASEEPLNLKSFVKRFELPVLVGGCASGRGALHLMRTGAVGVIVGVSTMIGIEVPLATAIAEVRAARTRHLDETGVYVHIIAAGGLSTGAEVAKAMALGADAVMLGAPLAATLEAPGRGWYWTGTLHRRIPKEPPRRLRPQLTMAELLTGPSDGADPGRNIFGSLREAMALCGYETVKELQGADLVVRAGPGGPP